MFISSFILSDVRAPISQFPETRYSQTGPIIVTRSLALVTAGREASAGRVCEDETVRVPRSRLFNKKKNSLLSH